MHNGLNDRLEVSPIGINNHVSWLFSDHGMISLGNTHFENVNGRMTLMGRSGNTNSAANHSSVVSLMNSSVTRYRCVSSSVYMHRTFSVFNINGADVHVEYDKDTQRYFSVMYRKSRVVCSRPGVYDIIFYNNEDMDKLRYGVMCISDLFSSMGVEYRLPFVICENSITFNTGHLGHMIPIIVDYIVTRSNTDNFMISINEYLTMSKLHTDEYDDDMKIAIKKLFII